MNVSGMKLSCLLEEQQTRMSVHHILYQWHKVLGNKIVPVAKCEEGNELSSIIMTGLDQSPPCLGQLDQCDTLHLVTT